MCAEGARTSLDPKRVLDVVVASVGLLVLSPLIAVLAWRVRHELGSPVLFHQQRPGLHGQLFTLHKFRTMTDGRSPDGGALPDGDRLTPFGRWLRATSLDELPELWNVLRGQMSLVGPRPLLVEYLELYSPRQARRHEVPPGLTGWAQVHGRNDLSWPEKLELDVWYVEHRSLWLDLGILARTLVVALRREGVTLDGHDTTVRFAGEPDVRDPDGIAGA
jgi:sugar transferase EpsL